VFAHSCRAACDSYCVKKKYRTAQRCRQSARSLLRPLASALRAGQVGRPPLPRYTSRGDVLASSPNRGHEAHHSVRVSFSSSSRCSGRMSLPQSLAFTSSVSPPETHHDVPVRWLLLWPRGAAGRGDGGWPPVNRRLLCMPSAPPPPSECPQYDCRLS